MVTVATALALGIVATWSARAPSATLEWTQLVLLGGLIGIGTNWVAIRMLFRPKRRQLGVQGLIPANRDRIAAQIAAGVAANLLDRDTIRRAVHDSNVVQSGLDDFVAGLQRVVRHPEFREDLHEILVGYVGAFVNDERLRTAVLDAVAAFAKQAPEKADGVLKMFAGQIGTWLESKVRENGDAILRVVETKAPAIVSELSDRIAHWVEGLPVAVRARRAELERFLTEHVASRAAAFDVEGVVRRRLEDYSVDDLEALILRATDQHLTWLQLLGWLIGALAAPLVRAFQTLLG